jgi:hypothetical protein
MEHPKPEKIRFVYEKSRHHRSFHADGAWASTTPQGEVQISFFNDLRPMPNYTVHAVDDTGNLGAEVSREIQEFDVTRELNVTIVMNADTIKQVIALLGGVLARLDDVANQAAKKETEPTGNEVSKE